MLQENLGSCEGKRDLIHFDFGIDDRATPVADYRERLGRIVDRLAATGAKLVWATTTPIPDVPAKGFAAKAVVERNAVAAEVMEARGVAVNDLFSAMSPHVAEYRLPDDVRFNAAGYDFLAAREERRGRGGAKAVRPAPGPSATIFSQGDNVIVKRVRTGRRCRRKGGAARRRSARVRS